MLTWKYNLGTLYNFAKKNPIQTNIWRGKIIIKSISNENWHLKPISPKKKIYMENLVNVNEGIIVISGIFFLALLRGCQFETSKVESAPETALECFFSGTTRLGKKRKKKPRCSKFLYWIPFFSLKRRFNLIQFEVEIWVGFVTVW